MTISKLFDPKSIFSDVEPNPTFDTCQNAIDFSRTNEFDGVVAIGGGSVMDSAKAVIASMSTCENNCKRLLSGENQYINKISNKTGWKPSISIWDGISMLIQEKKFTSSASNLEEFSKRIRNICKEQII